MLETLTFSVLWRVVAVIVLGIGSVMLVNSVRVAPPSGSARS